MSKRVYADLQNACESHKTAFFCIGFYHKNMRKEKIMSSIYKDIAERCGGNIYIGVVGPVRCGKSTFIKKFMEKLVLPNIADENVRARTLDEMPQSAMGKTVMTTEPKFVPDEPVTVTLSDGAVMNVKMIDCVGYIIPEAMGLEENGEMRLVNTPWSDAPMPFRDAAELGTKKVISEHSTIAVALTCDGSITDIPRECYIDAERRIFEELKAKNKPFVILLNSARPESGEAQGLALSLEREYLAPVALVNCLELELEDIREILALTLSEFPLTRIDVSMPKWCSALASDHEIRRAVRDFVYSRAASAHKVSDLHGLFDDVDKCKFIETCEVREIDLSCGRAEVAVSLDAGLYYNTVSEMTGLSIENEAEMISTLCTLAAVKKKYDRVAEALEAAETTGYGIVMPEVGDLKLEEPEIVRQSGGWGVKLRASAPSLHFIKAGIETEISPVVGTEEQSENLVKFLVEEFEENPAKIWESNMFGRTLYDLVNDGLHAKLENMPDDARAKLSETLGRIINEGSGGLICIIL